MEFPLVIRHRLKELGTEQRELAKAARVTDSYVSQLLTGKKAPPSPDRTDIYGRMERFLRLPPGRLAALAEDQRTEALKRKLTDPPAPLCRDVRDLILRKCPAAKNTLVRAIFEKESFGTLERLVTQKLLDVVKRVATAELQDDTWLGLVARHGQRTDEQMRVIVLDFLETDVFNVTAEHCVTFLDPLIESWDLDLQTFGMEIVLNRRLAPVNLKKLEFVEREGTPAEEEPGFRDFLQDASLSGGATARELEFLKQLRFTGKRPMALYYYRELQNLRDPLHFRP